MTCRIVPVLALMVAATWPAAAAPAASGKGTSVRCGPLHGGEAAKKLALDITGEDELVLMATGYSWGQAVWGEPVLVSRDGTSTKLTELRPVSAQVGWGAFSVNQGPDGKPLSVAGRVFAHGLFAHADSAVVYALGGRYARFEAWVGISDTANRNGRVVFEARDRAGFEREQARGQLRRGFTRECLASLRRSLDRTAAEDTARAARVPELRGRLDAVDRDFEALRAALDGDPEPARDRLDAFRDLVREIRLLRLDGPLLFVRRHAYFAPHIYDDHLTWHPGGGIYVIENPDAPIDRQVVRPVIDPSTKATLGVGVYRDPDLSFDGRRILFAFKGQPEGDTSLYEIALDGTGLRRLTDPSRDVACPEKPAGLYGCGHHDYTPCYLPGGRIAFVSTRTAGLVMCFNNHIATLHTMNADGSDLKPISVNNVTEFDPTVMPDGRILYGRWEYVDKTALYIQSLWTVNPDGTQETALFKNNRCRPTAVLDARPVPGSDLIVASLTPHNGQSVGAIAMIDPRKGKNTLEALVNFTPEYPTEMDQGLARGPCDPWPLDEDTVLIADNAERHGAHGVIELIDRHGFRFVIRREPDISCFSPVTVRARPEPPVRPSLVKAGEAATFLVHDVYRGLAGVRRGEVKRLRLLETTSRVSGVPPGGRWWNQAFLVSWQGSYDVKNVLGVVPVEPDGSAYFEVPPGKAVYVQALDANGRLVQSMRTFVQAAPGVTRSCQGCHVADDDAAPGAAASLPLAARKAPASLQPESWGRGLIDFPRQVQPVLDRRCVRCHGGAEDIASGVDLSGGWTWAFNLGYEALIKNTLTGFLNCENGSVRTADLLPPRTHGSGAAPLAALLLDGHGGRLEGMPRSEVDLLMAWMDGNCNYYGTWDYTENAVCEAIVALREPLLDGMEKAGCLRCHGREIGSDWVNLQDPRMSRLLRAPAARQPGGPGLGWCRDRKARPIRLPLVTQRNQPPDVFRPSREAPLDPGGRAVVSFESPDAPAFRSLLAILERGRAEALKKPRVDMPGAVVHPGRFRELPPLTPPAPLAGARAAAGG
jgi:hypothetical protein